MTIPTIKDRLLSDGKPFFVVWNAKAQRNITYVHETEEAARAAAQKLATEHGADVFFVLASVAHYRTKCVEVVDLEERE